MFRATSFYLDCGQARIEATSGNCVRAQMQWRNRAVSNDYPAPDQMCPMLRYVYLKKERLWFKCCGPEEYEMKMKMEKFEVDWTERYSRLVGDFQQASGLWIIKAMMKIQNQFKDMVRNITGMLFTPGAAVFGGVKGIMQFQRQFLSEIKQMGATVSDSALGAFKSQRERLEYLERVNLLTCKMIKPVAGALENGNVYLDGKVDICFETGSPGYDPAKAEYTWVAPHECIHLAGKNTPSPVYRAKISNWGFTGLSTVVVQGQMNAFDWGPKKRKYEVVFL